MGTEPSSNVGFYVILEQGPSSRALSTAAAVTARVPATCLIGGYGQKRHSVGFSATASGRNGQHALTAHCAVNA